MTSTVNAGGGCEAAVTARTRCGWVKLRECGELLYGRFPLKLKGAVYGRYVRPAILYECEAWCLKGEMGILRRTERSMVRAMSGVELKNKKRSTEMTIKVGLKRNNSSVDYEKQCSMVWPRVEERGWSRLKKGIRF